MNLTTIADLYREVSNGSFDSELPNILEAIKSRKDFLKEQSSLKLRLSLKKGQTVYFVDSIRPTYLAGLSAKIRKINPKRVVLDLDRPAGRFHKGLTCPLTLLTTVAP